MSERVMARVVRIDAVEKHPNADALDICTVGGWRVVTKIGEYKAGDLAVYCEVDSWVPTEIASFLSKGKEPREFNGIKGERLKTARLRGELSQGLLLSFTETLADYAKDFDDEGQPFWMGPEDFFQEGDDVSEVLGIQKWEAPVPACLAGMMRGNFPTDVPKTDQSRCQNLVAEINAAYETGLLFEVTEKLEGSSCTMYLDMNDDFHVCSRNLDLKEDDTNSFWQAAKMYDVKQRMLDFGMSGYAIQGELIGNKLNGNIYRLSGIDFYVYDIYDVRSGKYLSPEQRRKVVADLGLKHVPVLEKHTTTGTVEDLIAFADGKSMLYDTLREGVVFKQVDGPMTFKAISNEYLLKSGG